MIFTLFDILILTIITISSLFGLYKGMIHITMNLLGFIASIIVAIVLFPYVARLFSGHIENDLINSIAAGVTSYIISLVIFTFLVSKVMLLFAGSSRGFLDRSLGFAVGAVRGGIMALILFATVAVFTTGTYSSAEKAEDVVLNLSSDQYPEWLKISTTVPCLEKALKYITLMIPQEMLDSIVIPHNSDGLDEDIIETIKKRKNANNVKSSVGEQIPIDKSPEDK